MRVIVTGSTTWSNRDTMRLAFRQLPSDCTIIHGDCAGADALASEIAAEFGFAVERWLKTHSDYAKYKTTAWKGLNERMLESGVTLVLAFHADWHVEGKALGTKHMLAIAEAAKVETRAYAS